MNDRPPDYMRDISDWHPEHCEFYHEVPDWLRITPWIGNPPITPRERVMFRQKDSVLGDRDDDWPLEFLRDWDGFDYCEQITYRAIKQGKILEGKAQEGLALQLGLQPSHISEIYRGSRSWRGWRLSEETSLVRVLHPDWLIGRHEAFPEVKCLGTPWKLARLLGVRIKLVKERISNGVPLKGWVVRYDDGDHRLESFPRASDHPEHWILSNPDGHVLEGYSFQDLAEILGVEIRIAKNALRTGKNLWLADWKFVKGPYNMAEGKNEDR